MSKTTFLYRHINYRSSAKAKRSLHHSLRIKNTDFTSLEWNVNLTSEHTYYWHSDFKSNNNEITSSSFMNEQTSKERQTILNDIIDNLFKYNATTEDRNNLTKYKAKLKKKIRETTDYDELKNVLNDTLLNPAESDYTLRINFLKNIKRKNQLLSMLDKYNELYTLCMYSSDRRSAKLHEAIFKIPAYQKQKTNNDVRIKNKRISPQDSFKIIRSFYKKIAPKHDIKLTVYHDDERKTNTEKFSGGHVHVFLSCKNNASQKYDLNKTIKKYVNNYLKKNSIEFIDEITNETLLINEITSSYRDQQIFGSILQDIFLDHIRKLKPDYDFNFTDERKHRFNKRLDKYADAKNRKSDREYSYYNLIKEEEQKLKESIIENRKVLNNIELEKNKIAANVSNFVIDIINSTNKYITAVHNEEQQDEIKRKRNDVFDLIQQERYSIKLNVSVVRSLINTITNIASVMKVNVNDFITIIKEKFNS